ncbi:hypothetical protein BGZ46_007660 [Entomortierella lignicola]|nr:hypothetical protein BGZ46_007660 [Entomortierella lignicola]
MKHMRSQSFISFGILIPIAVLLIFVTGSVKASKKCSNTCPEEIQTVCGVSHKNGRSDYKNFPNSCIMEFHNCIFPNSDFVPVPIPASFDSEKFYSCEVLGYHTEL